MIKALGIATPDAEKPVGQLSGGNQQKVVLARSLVSSPSILILDEPTRGIDVGAHAEVVTLIRNLCAQGLALLVASSELEELVAVSDRIAVLRDRQDGRRNRAAATSPAKTSSERSRAHDRDDFGRPCKTEQRSLVRGCAPLVGHRAVWPILALALILAVDGFISPDFFHIRIVEGRLFGNLIDILYRATPTALVALGMAIVIGTKGIDLSVGSIIAIVRRGDRLAHPRRRSAFRHSAARARDGRSVRAMERVPGRRSRHPADHRNA